jgi:hypothetical protein
MKLGKYSARQIAVATTWATHFNIKPEKLYRFIAHYLHETSSTKCWCVYLEADENNPRRALARLGSQLQYFDGRFIWGRDINKKLRVASNPPTQMAALELVKRLFTNLNLSFGSAILTSFSKQARSIATSISMDCLGMEVDSEYRHQRYFGPRNRFYLGQIGSAIKRFCACIDQDILHTLRSVQCPSAALYNWLSAGDRPRRMQALRAQPVLVPLIVLSDSYPWPKDEASNFLPSPASQLDEFHPIAHGNPEYGPWYQHGSEIMAVIADQGLSILETLSWLFIVPKSALRFLGKNRVYDIGSALTHIKREGLNSGWQALLAGAQLGNRRPQTKRQWAAYGGAFTGSF